MTTPIGFVSFVFSWLQWRFWGGLRVTVGDRDAELDAGAAGLFLEQVEEPVFVEVE
jgi:hypothetical protein